MSETLFEVRTWLDTPEFGGQLLCVGMRPVGRKDLEPAGGVGWQTDIAIPVSREISAVEFAGMQDLLDALVSELLQRGASVKCRAVGTVIRKEPGMGPAAQ